MKLSAVYNFFDGGEFLVRNLERIRSEVDHVVLVDQAVSNYGAPQAAVSAEAVREVLRRGLVDDYLDYEPDLRLGGSRNEFAKRTMGREMARDSGASHALWVDADEFYIDGVVAKGWRLVQERLWPATVVPFVNYYATPTWRLRGVAGYVPFIASIETIHEWGASTVVPVDPTRMVKVAADDVHVFRPEDVTMHHMTGVRRNLEEKLANSSQNDDPAVIGLMRERFTAIASLSPGRYQLPEGLEIHIDEVDDLFGLGEMFPRGG